MYGIEVRTYDANNRFMKWERMHPIGGEPYEFATKAEAERVLKLCYGSQAFKETARVKKLKEEPAPLMTTAEYIAVDCFISEYPEDATYDEVITSMRECEVGYPDNISTCEHYEDWYAPRLAQEIDNLASDIERRMVAKS